MKHLISMHVVTAIERMNTTRDETTAIVITGMTMRTISNGSSPTATSAVAVAIATDSSVVLTVNFSSVVFGSAVVWMVLSSSV